MLSLKVPVTTHNPRMTRLPNYRPSMRLANQPTHMNHVTDDAAVLDHALEVHANVRHASQWVKPGTPTQVSARELEMLQAQIKTLIQNIITPAAGVQPSRPHKAYIEALSDFRIAISMWLLNMRRGMSIASNAALQFELHACKTEFLGKLWLNTIAAPVATQLITVDSAPDKTPVHTNGSLRKFTQSGWWQSKRSPQFGWSTAPQTM